MAESVRSSRTACDTISDKAAESVPVFSTGPVTPDATRIVTPPMIHAKLVLTVMSGDVSPVASSLVPSHPDA